MKQYLELCNRILDEGVMIPNERTGKGTLTVINADMVYDVGAGEFPLVTTRKCFWKASVAELLGYLRGYDNAADFRKIGSPTWDANANENEAWLANPFRKGGDDLGRVYGVVGRGFNDVKVLGMWWGDDSVYGQQTAALMDQGYKNLGWDDGNDIDVWHRNIDQLRKVYENLKKGIDDRGEIISYWNPAEFNVGCLRPCLHTNTFSLLGDTLHLTSYQRSCDVPLGLTFNMVQCYVLLAIMAQITGHKAGKVYHKIVNAHIYEDQIELMREQVKREPFASPTFGINPNIRSLEDIETWVTTDDFELFGYEHHEAIKYPFSV